MEKIIYFDNAASSWPKPPSVAQAVFDAINDMGANPGRGAHKLALEAGRIVYNCRNNLAELFQVKNPNDIVFTKNATEAINLPLLCYLQPSDHVITTSLEHNSVIRPLEYLRQSRQIEYSLFEADRKGMFDLNYLEELFKKQANLKMLIVSHGSNTLGTIFPLQEACQLAKQYRIRILVDSAQTAGVYNIPIEAWGIDFLAFPGHKGLFGPQGTGGLYITPEIEMAPLLHGGTGGNSESKEMPTVRPDRYESGTPNTPGLAGLDAGITYIRQQGIDKIREQEWILTKYIMEKLHMIDGIEIFGPPIEQERAAIISFNIRGLESNEVAYMLDSVYNIAVRAGLHCAPSAHETVGTLSSGMIRVSPGYFNTIGQADVLIDAIEEIVSEI